MKKKPTMVFVPLLALTGCDVVDEGDLAPPELDVAPADVGEGSKADVDASAELAASSQVVTLASDWRKPAGAIGFHPLPAGTEEFVLDGQFTAAAAATHIRVRIDPELTMCGSTWTGTCAEYAEDTTNRSVFRYKVRVEQLAGDGTVCSARYWAGGSSFTGDPTVYSSDVTIARDPHHEPFYWTVPAVPVSTGASCTRRFRIRTALKSLVDTDPIRLEPGLRNWSLAMVYNLMDGEAL